MLDYYLKMQPQIQWTAKYSLSRTRFGKTRTAGCGAYTDLALKLREGDELQYKHVKGAPRQLQLARPSTRL